MNCGQQGGCGGCCGNCGGCASALVLGQAEVSMLLLLGQYAFLPVGRTGEDDTPLYPGETEYRPEDISLALRLLERRRLITIDFDQPLNISDPAYRAYPIRGSFALLT